MFSRLYWFARDFAVFVLGTVVGAITAAAVMVATFDTQQSLRVATHVLLTPLIVETPGSPPVPLKGSTPEAQALLDDILASGSLASYDQDVEFLLRAARLHLNQPPTAKNP